MKRGKSSSAPGLLTAWHFNWYFGFYCGYSITHESWWSLRFVLPAVSALVILAVAGAEELLRPIRSRTQICRALVGTSLGLFIGNAAWQFRRLPILYSWRDNQAYRDSAVWIEQSAPKSAVILSFQASGALYFYTSHPLICSEHLTESDVVAVLGRLIALGQPVYAVVFPREGITSFSRLPGRWSKGNHVSTILRFVKLDPSQNRSAPGRAITAKADCVRTAGADLDGLIAVPNLRCRNGAENLKHGNFDPADARSGRRCQGTRGSRFAPGPCDRRGTGGPDGGV